MLLKSRLAVFESSTGSPSPRAQSRIAVLPGVPRPLFFQLTLLPPLITTFAHGPVTSTESRLTLAAVLYQPCACPFPVATVTSLSENQSPFVFRLSTVTAELGAGCTITGPARAVLSGPIVTTP